MDPTKKIKTNNEGQENKIFNLDNLIAFRQDMHTYPEIGFQEVETSRKIKEFCLKIGVQESQITVCAKTGYYIDIYGKAPASGKKTLIALRADIDALSMTEENPHLPYKSKTNAAHMCGHDGHTTTLLGFMSLYLERLEEIPADKGVRFLFQPSEEGPLSGAKAMLAENCLDGVNECYGYHNWPTHPVGYCLVKPGAQMASVSLIRITLIGKGGHGSKPESAIDPVQMSLSFHLKFNEMLKTKFKGRKMVSTIPVLKVGERYNVIAGSGYLEGTLRSLENELPDLFEKGLTDILNEVKSEFPGSDYNLDFEKCVFDQVDNTEKETEIVTRLAKDFFGEDKVGSFDTIPVMASEDYSFFIQKVPGVYFFLGSGRKMNDTMLHDCHYNFNDELITPGAQFFMRIIEDRLGLEKKEY